MSSATAKLGSRDAYILLQNCSSTAKKCSNSSGRLSVIDPEDVQEADGADSGNTWKNGNNESKSENSSPKSSDAEDEDFGIALRQIFSDTNPVKVISAMKGGREKNGLSPRKVGVKWAEDVYDPPPSIESHTRGGKKHHQKLKFKDKENQKKNSKRNQKGGNSSWSGKDSTSKKQLRKNSSNCGGSFLKANQTKVHFSVTEAR